MWASARGALARPAAVATLVAALACLAGIAYWASAQKDARTFTNGVIIDGFNGFVYPGQTLCTGPIRRPGRFNALRVSMASRRIELQREVTPKLLLTLRVHGGRTLARGRLARIGSFDAGRDYATARVPAQGPGPPVDVCIRNAGNVHVVLFAGHVSATRGATVAYIGAKRNLPVPEVGFLEEPPKSLLRRFHRALVRSAAFRPEWTGAWTFYLLFAGVIFGVPLLGAAALGAAASMRDAEGPAGAGRGEDGEDGSYETFMREVEPALGGAPRVHLFAKPVLTGAPGAPAEPLAVVIDSSAGGDGAATRASLDAQTTAATEVHDATPAEGLAAATGEWVLLVRAGDTLAPNALERLGQAVRLAPAARLVTCDEDALDAAGARTDPCLRPGPSPDFALTGDRYGALLCVRRASALELSDADSAWALAHALAGERAEGHAHVPLILCHRAHGSPASAPGAPGGRVTRAVSGEPTVEAIVLFRDKPELLRRCVRSLLDRSSYEHLSARLVDNGSVESETKTLVGELEADERVAVMRDERDFNFAALNNAALARSEADFVVFLNNDTEVISPDWVEVLLAEAQRPEVGAVAPLLLYPDGTVQHAGAALGIHGYAGHPFAGLAPDAPTPFGSAAESVRNWLAVTAACMMVQRRKLTEVGGFDESFVVAGNDVDLCLRLGDAGYRTLFTPHAQLRHDESRSRGAHIDPQDFVRSEQRYGSFRTVGDPFYNPSLTLARTDCSLRRPGE